MKVIVPMAGRGSRFANHGVTIPKPLIPVAGKPMLFWALEGLDSVVCSEIIFVVLKEHQDAFHIDRLLAAAVRQPFELVLIDRVTEGQLCTVLAARAHINSDEDLLISSSDTLVESNIGEAIRNRPADCHGLISVADLPGDHWSFARIDGAGDVVEVAEKSRISNLASTGLYYFSNGAEFVAESEQMVRNQEKTRGEYYVIPVYQKYIQSGRRVQISQAREMYDMGTPEALADFERHIQGMRS